MCGDLYRAGRGCAHFHGVELNLSCPNIAEGGHDFGSRPGHRARLPRRGAGRVAGPRAHRQAHAERESHRAAGGGGGGGRAPTRWRPSTRWSAWTWTCARASRCLPRRFGGYSGPAILPIALAKVDEIVRETGVPVIGVGGIQAAADALKFFALGAVAVQVGTAQMRDPFAAARVARDLRRRAPVRAASPGRDRRRPRRRPRRPRSRRVLPAGPVPPARRLPVRRCAASSRESSSSGTPSGKSASSRLITVASLSSIDSASWPPSRRGLAGRTFLGGAHHAGALRRTDRAGDRQARARAAREDAQRQVLIAGESLQEGVFGLHLAEGRLRVDRREDLAHFLVLGQAEHDEDALAAAGQDQVGAEDLGDDALQAEVLGHRRRGDQGIDLAAAQQGLEGGEDAAGAQPHVQVRPQLLHLELGAQAQHADLRAVLEVVDDGAAPREQGVEGRVARRAPRRR